MLKKMMAKLGKGSAKIDLVLDHDTFQPGDEVTGELQIRGGTVEQSINRIDVDLMIRAAVKDQVHEECLLRVPVYEAFTLSPDEEKTLPFTMRLPEDLPVSGHSISFYFTTRLDIKAGVDHLDTDPILIQPPDRIQHVLNAFQELGFSEQYESRKFTGYAQEFALYPPDHLRGTVEEVEFVAAMEPNGLRLLMEVDMRSLFREVEIKREIVFTDEQLNDESFLAAELEKAIDDVLQNPQSYQYPFVGKKERIHRHSGLTGAVGGFAAGVLGGLVLASLMDDLGELGSEDEGEGEDGGDEGGFFDDFDFDGE